MLRIVFNSGKTPSAKAAPLHEALEGFEPYMDHDINLYSDESKGTITLEIGEESDKDVMISNIDLKSMEYTNGPYSIVGCILDKFVEIRKAVQLAEYLEKYYYIPKQKTTISHENGYVTFKIPDEYFDEDSDILGGIDE